MRRVRGEEAALGEACLVLGGAHEGRREGLGGRPGCALVPGAAHERPPGVGALSDLVEQKGLPGGGEVHQDGVPAGCAAEPVHRDYPWVSAPAAVLPGEEQEGKGGEGSGEEGEGGGGGGGGGIEGGCIKGRGTGWMGEWRVEGQGH